MQASLSCSHEPSPHGEHTTGTAYTKDGREICWTCADVEQRESLKIERHVMAYLNHDRSQLTTWTGGLLARITCAWQVYNNFAGRIWRFRAVDVHGQKWYGTSPGPNMYARMHKVK